MTETRRSVKARVLQVLREHPVARDDNNALVGLVWQMEEPSLPADFLEKIQRLSKVETIRRECKKIQNEEGRFPPSAEVLKARQGRIGRRKPSHG